MRLLDCQAKGNLKRLFVLVVDMCLVIQEDTYAFGGDVFRYQFDALTWKVLRGQVLGLMNDNNKVEKSIVFDSYRDMGGMAATDIHYLRLQNLLVRSKGCRVFLCA